MNVKILILCILISTPMLCFAKVDCKRDSDDLYRPLSFKEGCLHFRFDKEPIDPGGSEFGIVITREIVGEIKESKTAELPFLAVPGEIVSAFFADTDFNNRPELLVIQKFSILSDAGVSYASDYYVSLVFDISNDSGLAPKRRVERYFGAGGDVFESSSSDRINYYYPYKSEISIRQQLASPWYQAWYEGKRMTATIQGRAYMHGDASLASETAGLLVSGDSVDVLGQEGGWLNVLYEGKEKSLKGWVRCNQTVECYIPREK